MAFVLDVTKEARTDGVSAASVEFEDWFEASDLQAGDYIMVVANTSTGSAVNTISGTWNRLNDVNNARVGSSFRSQIWWAKYDGITVPPAPTVSGSNGTWAVSSFVVRDAPDVSDQSWINTETSTVYSSSIRIFPIPSVTTTENDCLLLTILTTANATTTFETPDNFWGVDFTVAAVRDTELASSVANKVIVATRSAPTAGATPVYDYINGNTSGNRGQVWTIAVRNKVGGAKPIGVSNPPIRVTDFFEDNTFVHGDLTNLSDVYASIDGLTTFAPNTRNITTTQGIVTNNPPILRWYRAIALTPPTATTGFCGVRWELGGSFNYAAGLWYLLTQRASANQDHVSGVYHYFEDGDGNWAIFQFLNRIQGALYNNLIRHLPDETPKDESATPIDWTNITRRGIGYRQNSSNTTARTFIVGSECIQPFNAPLTFTGGGPSNPISARVIARALLSGAAWRLAFIQGQGQQVITTPFQLGDGVTPTYVDDEAQSLEYPSVGGILGYRAQAGRQEIRVRASADDSVYFDAGIKGTERLHNFVMDPATSTEAEYGMKGTFLGWNPVFKSGLVMRGGSYISCGKIDAKAADVSNSSVKNSVATDAAMRMEDGGIADQSTFTKGSEEYAIEIAGTGEVNLVGTEFIGYTEDLNILATSGTVTIVRGSDDSVPTYDTAGATVVIDQPVILALASVISIEPGSRIQVYNLTEDEEVANEIVAGTEWSLSYTTGTPFEAGDQVRVRLTWKEPSPGYTSKRPIETITIASSNGWSVLANQIDCSLCEAYEIDGSTLTGYVWDGSDIEVDVDKASNTWGVSRLYAWYAYFITTEVEIRDVFGRVVGRDIGNIELVNILLDNVRTTTALQTDNVRIFRADGTLPVKNPTTGGGGLTFYSTGTIFTAQTGISGLTPSESSQLSSLASTVSAGHVLADIRKINDIEVTGAGTAGDPWGP